jgi:transcriptional regulator with XRE-family HTH domain
MRLASRMATVPETIRRLRERAGLSQQEMAKRVGMNVPSYYDLEAVPEEWEEVAELSQLLELSRILKKPLLELVGESAAEVHEPLSFPELATLIRRQITEGAVQEDQIGWDLSEFWEEPMIAMEYSISFLKIVGEDVGFDWRRPILFYQNAGDAAPNGGPATQLGNSGVTEGPPSLS